MTATFIRSMLTGALVLLLVLAASSPALSQVDANRPFIGGTFFGEEGNLRQGWGVGGGVSAGWAVSETWGAQVEFEMPTWGTRMNTFTSPECAPGVPWNTLRCFQESRQELTVSVLFGRHLPAAGRFQAVVLFGPAARIERVREIEEWQDPGWYGSPAGTVKRYEDNYTNLFAAFVAGFDGQIAVGRNLSIVPQLRMYLSPGGPYGDGPDVIVRPGVSVRWRF